MLLRREADAAATAFAFERAAELYRLALANHGGSVDEARGMHAALAECLANMGHCAEAGSEYLIAAQDAPDEQAFDLRRRAAQRYLTSGHVPEGLAVLRQVLAAVGLRLPATPLGSLASLLWWRARLWLRGLAFSPRDSAAIPATLRRRLDACWSAVIGLSLVDPIRAADYVARNLWLSLGAGSPSHVARALAVYSGHAAIPGPAAAGSVEKLLAAGRRAAELAPGDYCRGIVILAEGIAALLQGRWSDSLARCDEARGIFRQPGSHDVAWELDTAQSFAMWALMYLGDVSEMTSRLPRLASQALARNDHYARLNFGTVAMMYVSLAADQAPAAREQLAADEALLPADAYHVQHHNAVLARTLLELYDGDAEAAWRTVAGGWTRYARSLLGRIQHIRIDFLQDLGRAAVAALARDKQSPALRRAASRRGRSLAPRAHAVGSGPGPRHRSWHAPLPGATGRRCGFSRFGCRRAGRGGNAALRHSGPPAACGASGNQRRGAACRSRRIAPPKRHRRPRSDGSRARAWLCERRSRLKTACLHQFLAGNFPWGDLHSHSRRTDGRKRMTRNGVLQAAVLFVLALLIADQAPAAEPAALDAAFELVEAAVGKGEVPGAIALVSQGGKLVREQTYGLADVEQNIPFTPRTICWVASITKPVTVAAAMKLVEEGRLGLDDPVEKYLPEFAELKDKDGRRHTITIRQLMCHTSGLQANPPLRPSFFFEQEFLRRKIGDVAAAIAQTPLQFQPGSQTQYSNAAPYVLARIIELRSGKPFHEHVQQTILDPAGMRDSYFIIPRAEARRAAVVYRDTQDERVVFFRFNPEWKVTMTLPDGGLFSSPREIARFLQVFLDDDGSVLAKSSVKAMRQRQSTGWGLGWALEENGSFRHSGSSGVSAWADPKTGVVGVLFCQLQNPDKVLPLQARFRQSVREAYPAP